MLINTIYQAPSTYTPVSTIKHDYVVIWKWNSSASVCLVVWMLVSILLLICENNGLSKGQSTVQEIFRNIWKDSLLTELVLVQNKSGILAMKMFHKTRNETKLCEQTVANSTRSLHRHLFLRFSSYYYCPFIINSVMKLIPYVHIL
jgi:hypothetical protein